MESQTLGERSANLRCVTESTGGSCVRTVALRKPHIKPMPMLPSAYLPHGIATTGGRSAECNGVGELTEGSHSRILDLRAPAVTSETLLISGDAPYGIASIGGRFADSSNVAEETEGLRSRVVDLHKPWVESVTLLTSAYLPHDNAHTGGRSVEFNRCYRVDRRFAWLNGCIARTFGHISGMVEFAHLPKQHTDASIGVRMESPIG